MPLVTIRIARRATPTTAEQKAKLIAGVTDVVQAVLDKRRESVTVIIDEVDPDNLGGRWRDRDTTAREATPVGQRRIVWRSPASGVASTPDAA